MEKQISYLWLLKVLIQAFLNTNRIGLMKAHSFPVPEKICVRNSSRLEIPTF